MATNKTHGDGVTLEQFSPSNFRSVFLDVPDIIYRDIPEYRAPLRFDKAALLKASSPYFQHAEGQYFVARRNGKPVGRISAQVDTLVQKSMGEGTGQFGFFECENDPEAAALLFGAAEDWLRSKGMTRSLGPFNPSINEEVGLLIEGFDTPNVILMPHGRPYYRGLVEQLGYDMVKELYAYDFDTRPPLADRFIKMVDWADRHKDIELRFLDWKDFHAEVKLALDIFNDAWRDNWGFTPMTDAEAERFSHSLKMIMRPEFAAFAYYKGEPAAFMFVLPDINYLTADFGGRLFPFNWAKLLFRMKRKHYPRMRTALLGTRKALQNSRIGGVLGIYLIEKIRRNTGVFRTTQSELSWILEDNRGMNNMLQSINGHIYKRYGMFEKQLS